MVTEHGLKNVMHRYSHRQQCTPSRVDFFMLARRFQALFRVKILDFLTHGRVHPNFQVPQRVAYLHLHQSATHVRNHPILNEISVFRLGNIERCGFADMVRLPISCSNFIFSHNRVPMMTLCDL